MCKGAVGVAYDNAVFLANKTPAHTSFLIVRHCLHHHSSPCGMHGGAGLHCKINGQVAPVRKQGIIALADAVFCAFCIRQSIYSRRVGECFVKASDNATVLQQRAGAAEQDDTIKWNVFQNWVNNGNFYCAEFVPPIKSKKAPCAGAFRMVMVNGYSASATTSFTSGIIRFIMPSMPALSVIMLEGQPEQLPCSIKFTTPLS